MPIPRRTQTWFALAALCAGLGGACSEDLDDGPEEARGGHAGGCCDPCGPPVEGECPDVVCPEVLARACDDSAGGSTGVQTSGSTGVHETGATASDASTGADETGVTSGDTSAGDVTGDSGDMCTPSVCDQTGGPPDPRSNKYCCAPDDPNYGHGCLPPLPPEEAWDNICAQAGIPQLGLCPDLDTCNGKIVCVGGGFCQADEEAYVPVTPPCGPGQAAGTHGCEARDFCGDGLCNGEPGYPEDAINCPSDCPQDGCDGLCSPGECNDDDCFICNLYCGS